MWVEALGLKICVLKDGHLEHLLGLNENGGVQALRTPRVKLEAKSSKSNNVEPSSRGKGWNKCKWGQGKSRLHDDKEKSLGKELTMKKTKWDLFKVKCFNCDNHEHLVKDYPKPPWVNDYISEGKLIFQGGFMAKMGAHKNEACNLLKLQCEISNELVCCFLDLETTNSFMTSQVVE
jgi:hypothetical protein